MVSPITMPHLFPFASGNSHAHQEDMPDSICDPLQHDPSRKRSASVLRRLHRIGDWLRRDDEQALSQSQLQQELHEEEQKQALNENQTPAQRSEDEPAQQDAAAPPRARGNSLLGRTLSKSKRVVPELPRQITFKRQISEKRDNLLPVDPSTSEKRAVSLDRRLQGMASSRRQSPPLTPLPSLSAPDVDIPDRLRSASADNHARGYFDARAAGHDDASYQASLPGVPPFEEAPPMTKERAEPDILDDRELQAELESKWILNLSMHFRDKSDREKFFVTYAQEPNRWRRVTVSCDYRDAPPDSLEADLKSLHYQRDKSQRIYEAIRESLPEIQFYDTVTNLKLETEDGQLHVHVTEDVNEVVSYPSTSLFRHVQCDRYRESDLEFQSHLSGFVYKVSADNRIFIKKEIPGPDTVDEFIYEIEALDALRGSKSVIEFHGLVVDEEDTLVKGLLISFASFGALVDIIYDYKTTDSLPWVRRERWAYQIIQGLCEIHEAGFVQGDFTLSNIVIDSEDDAKIIDINRRGCPIGWEPPELLRSIRSGQRISMRIGEKSDIYQLGMVLWALAEKHDEPEHVERTERGMPWVNSSDVPDWFKNIIDKCTSEQPQARLRPKELLSMFPGDPVVYEGRRLSLEASDQSFASHHSHKEYIDPAITVDRNDIEEFKRRQQKLTSVSGPHPTTDPFPFVDPATSTGYRLDSNGSYILPYRGRSPDGLYRSTGARSAVSSTTSLSLSHGAPRWEHICPEETPGHKDEGVPLYRRSDIEQQQRPSVPDAPPYHPRALEDIEEDAGIRRGRSRKNNQKDRESSPLPPAHRQRVFFGPPVHQDSGFDEFMTDAIGTEHTLSQPHNSMGPSHNLPPILTSTADAFDDANEGTSTLTQQSGSLLSHATLTKDTPTPQSPPTPITPFSYHTPLTSPFEAPADQQDTTQYLGTVHPDPKRPDSKYSPDPTQQ